MSPLTLTVAAGAPKTTNLDPMSPSNCRFDLTATIFCRHPMYYATRHARRAQIATDVAMEVAVPEAVSDLRSFSESEEELEVEDGYDFQMAAMLDEHIIVEGQISEELKDAAILTDTEVV